MQKDHLEILLESINSRFQVTLEAFQALSKKINTRVDELRIELKHVIAVVDSKVMGLSKRLDAVTERLSNEIAEVRNDLAAHRNNTELHYTQPKRPLKRA